MLFNPSSALNRTWRIKNMAPLLRKRNKKRGALSGNRTGDV
jgi:hypothetical protein